MIPAKPLSQMQSAALRWLFEPYLQRGRLAILDGDPAVGKSLISIDLAARLSRGATITQAIERPQVTILLGAEDNTADTVRPRAEAAGADLDRVIALDESDRVPLFFPESVPHLEELIRQHSADLVVIDPVTAFLPPSVAANLDQCVRQALGPLAALAGRTDCAILLIRHLRKVEGGRAIHRGAGSIGFIASARTGLLAAWHPKKTGVGILAVTKSNAATPAESLSYRIGTDRAGRALIEWCGPVELAANDLNHHLEGPLRIRDQASAWLVAELARGPRPASAILAAAAAAGIPERTLRRAKEQLRISSRKAHMKNRSEWYWYDLACDWPKDCPLEKPEPGELRPLEDFLDYVE